MFSVTLPTLLFPSVVPEGFPFSSQTHSFSRYLMASLRRCIKHTRECFIGISNTYHGFLLSFCGSISFGTAPVVSFQS